MINKTKRLLPVFLLFAAVLVSGCAGTNKEEAGSVSEEAAVSGSGSQTKEGGEKGLRAAGEGIEVNELTLEPVSVSESISEETPVKEEKKRTYDYTESTTLMIYMTGSDLESKTMAATNDMKEMEKAGADLSAANVIVFTGGSEKWYSDVPTDANAVFELTKDGFVMLESFDALSMGDSENLARFINYASENYPAEHTGLILWDHGNGPVMGCSLDRQFDDALTLPELEEALSMTAFGNENKLDFIGFDACLMSSLELARVVSPYADYLAASQETEPNFGWDYSFLEMLGHAPAKELLSLAVDRYLEASEDWFAENTLFHSDVTLAVMDLSKAAGLESCMNELFKKASDDVTGDFRELAVSRVNTKGVGRASTGSEYDLVDIKSLLAAMKEEYPKEAGNAEKALSEILVYLRTNTDDLSGISLFYPYYNKNYYENSWKEEYGALGVLSDYQTYLSRYSQIWLGTDFSKSYGEPMTPEEAKDSSYTLQLSPEQTEAYASAKYYILRREGDGLYAPIYISGQVEESDGLLTALFDGNIIYYKTDFGLKNPLLVRMDEALKGEDRYSAFPIVKRGNIFSEDYTSLSCRMQLSVNTKSGELTVNGIYDESEEASLNSGKSTPVSLSEWESVDFMNLTARYPVRNDDGILLDFFSWPDNGVISYESVGLGDNIQYVYEPLYDDGNEYFLAFSVMDVQGNSRCSELLPITLAKKPEGEKTEPTRLSFNEGGSLLLAETDELSCSLVYADSLPYGGPMLYFAADNRSDGEIDVNLENLKINNILIDTEGDFLMPKANGVYAVPLAAVNEAGILGGTGSKFTISFSVNAFDARSYDTVIGFTRYEITVSCDSLESERIVYPFHNLKADEQVLYDEGGVKLTLENMGHLFGAGWGTERYSGTEAALTAIVKLENHSGSTVTGEIGGFEFNDAGFFDSHLFTLEDGQESYILLKYDFYALDGWNPEKFDRAELIAVIGGKVSTLPVSLAGETGKEGPALFEGLKPFYEDGEVALYLKEFTKSEGSFGSEDGEKDLCWRIFMEGKGDKTIGITVCAGEGEDSEWLYSGNVVPGFIRAVSFRIYGTEKEAPLTVTMEKIGDKEDEPETVSFTLPVMD